MSNPKKSGKNAEQMRRELQFQQLEAAIGKLSVLADALKTQKRSWELLQSVSAGLYEEIDKLAKKSPADEISTLALEQVNDLIRESKELSPDDLYMRRYKVFVAAGDNPQHRDVVLILRQVRQGLDRFESMLSQRMATTTLLLGDSRGLRIAMLLILQGEERPSKSDLAANKVSVSDYWITGGIGVSLINISLLDRTDIPSYFAEPE